MVINYTMFFNMFNMLCTIGLTIQVILITIKYTDYEVTNSIRIDMPFAVEVPSLSLCFFIYLVLGSGHYSDYENTSVTLHDVFNGMLRFDDLLTNAVIRFPNVHLVQEFETTDTIRQNVDVSMFYVQEYVCYRLSIKTNGSLNFARAATAYEWPGMAFNYRLRTQLTNKTTSMVPVIHKSLLPNKEVMMARSVPSNDTDIRLSYQDIVTYSLSPPYQTQCRNYDQSACFSGCLINRTLDKLKMFPFTCIIPELNNYDMTRPLFPHDLGNRTLMASYESIIFGCLHQCPQITCRNVLTMTRIEVVNQNTPFNETQVRVSIPTFPNIVIKFEARFVFLEYLIYIMSCFGTWLGISVLSLNPVPVLVWMLNKYRPRNRNHLKPKTMSLAQLTENVHTLNSIVSSQFVRSFHFQPNQYKSH